VCFAHITKTFDGQKKHQYMGIDKIASAGIILYDVDLLINLEVMNILSSRYAGLAKLLVHGSGHVQAGLPSL
jgi:hypothetical protein